jgi:PPOX class probable F420-dependent enzyme
MATTPLDRERYVNLETFRKDGSGVKTPVWAAPLDGGLVVFSESKSYKVKRIRRDPHGRVAGCNVRGAVHGPWYEARCSIIEDAAEIERAHAAIRKKYGVQSFVTDFFAGLAGRVKKRTWLRIDVDGEGV